jgi:nitrogen fixation protein NifZ
VRSVRNDGTYPGLPIGAPLARCGSVGHVCDVGTFLQDQLIYSVHFLEVGRIIGCREQELVTATAPWVPSRFESRQRVCARVALAIDGEVIAPVGSHGEIARVLRDETPEVLYHVRFGARILQVPESALLSAETGPEG